jgi:7-cyano-7-deazaguanine synthase
MPPSVSRYVRKRHAHIGVLASGGLDSSILLGWLLQRGWRVQPFYVRTDVVWAAAEQQALEAFLSELRDALLRPLVVLEMPLADLYGPHWSITGEGQPHASTPDDAVYLPGRNPLLVIKPALWCLMHGVERLALATLAANPFADATARFCQKFAAALSLSAGRRIKLLRPFGRLQKRQVMLLGRHLPLEHTCSCLVPTPEGLHCGQCNKCAERQAAFRLAGMSDPTTYAAAACSPGDQAGGLHD